MPLPTDIESFIEQMPPELSAPDYTNYIYACVFFVVVLLGLILFFKSKKHNSN